MNHCAYPLIVLLLTGLAAGVPAQQKTKANTYIGYVYPAGGQQGTTVTIRIGGQKLTDIYGATLSGDGVSAEIVDCQPRLNPQDLRLIKEQQKLFKKTKKTAGEEQQAIEARQESVLGSYVRKPASESLSSLVELRVWIAKDATPGAREIRLQTAKGLSNPLPFYIGQLPEITRTPMNTSEVQVLGKEQLALRKRPDNEIEQRITLPGTLNGQIASGEVNRYRFEAKAGQKLIISTLARQLIPYIADAVPGWFQPVLVLKNAAGHEVAFNDDYFFKPDPVILYQVEADGEYILTIYDAIYRGREDFVYRVTIGETPFITSIFPLGGQAGKPATTKISGWNLQGTRLKIPSERDSQGVRLITANRRDILSNRVFFELDTLPECTENDTSNDSIQRAQRISLPMIINGRSDRPGDGDIYKISGRAGQILVAEVTARRLDSPLDSLLKLTDSDGRVLAFNDDHADPASGLNTHHADSYLQYTLPADGTYCIHVSDTAGNGGPAYAYRLRISEPRPDFELRTVPSRINLRGRAGGPVDVYAIRKDGYDGPIKLELADAPEGIFAKPVLLEAGEEKVTFIVRSTLPEQKEPIAITIQGTARIEKQAITHLAVPSEDWMQAYLWRHLVPTQELLVQSYSPSFLKTPERVLPAYKGASEVDPAKKENKEFFTLKKQIDRLYEERLISAEFYLQKAAEYDSYRKAQ